MSDDLISRQAAIDKKVLLENWAGQEYQAVIVEDIETLPSVQSEQRWIPVTERLPEVNGRYLVTRGLNTCGTIWNRVYLVNYSDLMGIISKRIWWNGNVGKSDFEHIDDVIAWMPLPAPYKEVE